MRETYSPQRHFGVYLCVRQSQFVRTIISIFMDGSQNNLTESFSLISGCSILRFHAGNKEPKERKPLKT